MTESQAAEHRLMEAVRTGDEEAFLFVYRSLQAPIYRFVLHMSGSRSTAEDVTQEAFLALIRDGEWFDAGKGTIAAYMIGTARNCLLQRLRKDRRLKSLVVSKDGAMAGPQQVRIEPDPLTNIVRDEAVRRVREAVVTLPIHYREVLVLCELEERSYQEASEILSCPTGTVRSRLHRARELLLQKLRTAESEAEVATATSRGCPA